MLLVKPLVSYNVGMDWRYLAPSVFGGLVIVLLLVLLHKGPPIPAKISSQLTSTLMLPQDPNFQVESGTAKYDKGLALLSYDVKAFGSTLTVSEQPTPQSFVDVPAAYQKVIENMNSYEDFNVATGTVYLTTPPQLAGKQAGVLNSSGTLTFVKPSGRLSDAQWRRFFTTFAVSHPSS